MPLELSKRQQAAVSAAVTIVAAFIILAAIGLLLWTVASFVNRFANVILPLAVAAVAALVFQPYYEWLQQKLRLPPTAALTAVFASVVLPLTAFFWFFGALAFQQISDLIAMAPEYWNRLSLQVQDRWPQVRNFLEGPYGGQLQDAVEGNSGLLVEALQRLGNNLWSAGASALSVVLGLLGWLVLPVYFAFFLMAEPREGADLKNFFPFLKPSTRDDLVYLIEEFISIIVAFFRGQLIIAFLQGLLFAVGFSIAGLNYGFVIGLALGFMNIIPYLGNIVGLGVAIPIALFQTDGGLGRLLAVLAVFAAVQMIEGYILTPRIMGERTGLHPMAIIVAIFFWGSALSGIVGMILAIPLTAFLVVFWRLAREKYVRELV